MKQVPVIYPPPLVKRSYIPQINMRTQDKRLTPYKDQTETEVLILRLTPRL